MPNYLVILKNMIKELPPARAYRRKKYDKYLATPEKIETAIRTYMGDNLTADERIAVAADIQRTAKEFRFDADEYFFYHLRDRTDEEKREFISDREGQEIRALLNKGKNREIFDNKYEAYLRFKKYYKRDVCFIKSENDFEPFDVLLAKHKSLIIKPVVDGSGHGVRQIVNSDDNYKLFASLRSDYPGGFVAEEIIKQVAEMAAFHPQSVNTIRITTIRLPDGVKEIHPFVRFGTGDRVVDNGGSNGLICTIDLETGRVYSAVDEADKRYERHPDTGMKIIGFTIPDWENAKKLAAELANVVPDNRYTGWDLALTDKGWVMVEGNASGMFIGWQFNDQIGFRSEMESYLKQLGIRYS